MPKEAAFNLSRKAGATPHPHFQGDVQAYSDDGGAFRGSSFLSSPRHSLMSPVTPPKDLWDPDHYVSGSSDASVVCAISENRDATVLGMAVINVTFARASVTRMMNDDSYDEMVETLKNLPTRPQVFLVLEKILQDKTRSQLVATLRREFSEALILPWSRDHWRESEALHLVRRYALKDDIEPVTSELIHNFYTCCALSAAVAYIERHCSATYHPNSIHVEFVQPARVMSLDRQTLEGLELIDTSQTHRPGHLTLRRLLDKTKTPQGRRLLMTSMQQPSIDTDIIMERWDVIEEFFSKEGLHKVVIDMMEKSLHVDVEKSIGWIARKSHVREPLEKGVAMVEGHFQTVAATDRELRSVEIDLNHILKIKGFLAGLRTFIQEFQVANATSRVIRRARDVCNLKDIDGILDAISNAINLDITHSSSQRDAQHNLIWAVRSSPKSLLEEARKEWRKLVGYEEAHKEEVMSLFAAKTGVEPTKADDHNGVTYFHYAWSDLENFDDGLFDYRPRRTGNYKRSRIFCGIEVDDVNRKRDRVSFTTKFLQGNSLKFARLAETIISESDEIVTKLKTNLVPYAAVLLNMGRAVALLDMMAALADLAKAEGYIRPQLTDDDLVLENVRHPVLSARCKDFVSNSVFTGSRNSKFLLVSGGNMSGKSTLIKSVALIQVLAQMGSYVPATVAMVPVIDKLFTRLSLEDNPEQNKGSFSVEMAEMNRILRKSTKKSLVIIDELGRGSSPKEGLALALSMTDMLLRRGCRVFFATHFPDLGEYLNAADRMSVLVTHMQTKRTVLDNRTIVEHDHKLRHGPVQDVDSGLELARNHLPERINYDAAYFLKKLLSRKTTQEGPMTQEAKKASIVRNMLNTIRNISRSSFDNATMARHVELLRTETKDLMEKVEAGSVNEVAEEVKTEFNHELAEKSHNWQSFQKQRLDLWRRPLVKAHMKTQQHAKKFSKGLKTLAVENAKDVAQHGEHSIPKTKMGAWVEFRVQQSVPDRKSPAIKLGKHRAGDADDEQRRRLRAEDRRRKREERARRQARLQQQQQQRAHGGYQKPTVETATESSGEALAPAQAPAPALCPEVEEIGPLTNMDTSGIQVETEVESARLEWDWKLDENE
ncbi:muts domain V-domain-containing protein [Podospora australis]|uniref:Muts domain V-domain-containing protein n=1 Tax=Podospora australis TaxID=1536484 RepID=A0AAN6WL69_9PEZI|nr:muts domain V-domain-containing protein [Podospora australis]